MNRTRNDKQQKGIRIVRSFDCMDLRKITSQSHFLQEEIKKYHMQHLDCVLYTNEPLTRFRLILNIHSTGFLCIPEIDEISKHSLYLRISEVLSKLSGVTHVVVNIEDISTKIRERIQKQEQREASKLEQERENVVKLRKVG
jgi:hypothetical protein